MDIGLRLDREGIAVRTGHHCCQPIMERLQISSTTRASFAMYNTLEEVDALARALRRIVADEAGRAKSSASTEKRAATNDSDATVEYPLRAASSPQEAADQLASDFEFLEERDAKNEYVLDLSNRLPHTFELLKKVTTRVAGCMSEVYIVTRRAAGGSDELEFVADANADMVRGLIAILQRIYSGQSAQSILEFDIESFFRRIGLDQFITSQRRNGLAGMVQRIRAAAEALSSGSLNPR
jgi:cysteine desulfurase/selenocysteine lyase